MTTNRVLIMTCLAILTSGVNAASLDHYEGEAYLQTVEGIESWTVQKGIVKTGLPWFDQLALQYSISALRTVDISCQINLFFYHIEFDNGYTVDEVCDDFNQEAEVIQAWPVIIPEWYAIPDDQYYSNQWGMTQIDAPSAGEFIRWSVAVRPTNGETVPSLVAGSAQAPPNNHWNGRTK